MPARTASTSANARPSTGGVTRTQCPPGNVISIRPTDPVAASSATRTGTNAARAVREDRFDGVSSSRASALRQK
jgi:hypothetical protein